jgi:predicted permease
VESFVQDLRYALRILLKAPASSVISILTLAFGIGANTAMFGIVNAWLLRPLPLKDPQRLVGIWRTQRDNPRQPAFFDFYRDYLIWSGENRSFESLGAMFEQSYALTGSGEPRELHGSVATWNLFRTVGAKPELGRLFVAEDGQGEPACVISHALWTEQLHAAHDVVGQSITLNRKLYRVLGVLPADFSLRTLDRPFETAVWTVITADDKNYAPTSAAAIAVVGRLKRGASIEQSQVEMSMLQERLNHRFSDEPEGSGVLVVNLQQDNTRTLRSSLLLLFAAVLVLLVIACVNTGSLILGRNAQRAREFAMRVALGSGTWRLLQQLSAEVLVLFVIGGIAGLLIASILVRIFVTWNPFTVLPPGGISLDLVVLGTTAAAVCLTALLFGSLPALRALRVRENEALRTASATTTAARSQLSSRLFFVAAEISLSVMLLVGAGLLISTFIKIDSEPLGFGTHDVFVTSVAIPYSDYPSSADRSRFGQQLLARLREIPAIRAAGIALTWPFNVNGLPPIELEGSSSVPTTELPQAAAFDVSDGYFDALGIPLLRGRAFDQHDTSDSEHVAVINDQMARQYFGKDDPIGDRIRRRDLDEKEAKEPWLTVVGIVGTTRSLRYNAIQWDRYPAVYTSIFQPTRDRNVHNSGALTIFIYFEAARSLSPAALASAVHQIDPNLPLGEFRSTGEIVSSLRSQPRVRATLLGTFGLLTLLLAAIGVGGVMNQMVEQRRREMGIRIALGAQPSDIHKLILTRSLLLTASGIAVGIAGAMVVTHLLRGFVYGISNSDPTIFAATIALLCTVAMLAAYVPAHRAARTDPTVTLRCE